jgi:hypothetical protein
VVGSGTEGGAADSYPAHRARPRIGCSALESAAVHEGPDPMATCSAKLMPWNYAKTLPEAGTSEDSA